MFIEVLFNLPLHTSFTYETNEKDHCEVGFRVMAPIKNRNLTGFVISVSETFEATYQIKKIKRVIDKESLFGQEEIELASWISSLYLCSQGEALSVMIPGGRREIEVPSLGIEDTPSSSGLILSEHQKEAIKSILAHENDLYYLFGVTGSGKTEVFLQTAQKMIEEGKSIIYLVPEISLTHQLAAMVNQRFPDDVAILHSSLTPSQRLKEWRRIRKDEVHLIIGARSAIFAPCKDIGMIIIDEEHENSYKSGSTPRYHARQIAMKRAALHDAVVVMGSATPSLEAWRLMGTGRIKRLDLPNRVSGGSMPAIEIVNISGNPNILSKTLVKGIQEVLAKEKQAILFLNRRGFSYFFHCRTCGYEMHCRDCSVPLTYHKHKHRMVCHYCGYSERPITSCPSCGSVDVGYSGFGTELVEDTVRQTFPQARIGRLDADVTKDKKQLKEILDSFSTGELDILLGTQMVAKGLNFPNVELVGIVLADSGLHLPDFRAQERTFSLLLQVAGRSGRFSDDGKVIIQTYHPENAAIQAAASGELEAFYEEELQMRSQLEFPPMTRLCRLVFRSSQLDKVRKAADTAADIMYGLIDELEYRDVDILGPAEAPIAKISSNYRYQVLVRSADFKRLHKTVGYLSSVYKPEGRVYLEIDFDPVNLL